MSDHAEKDQKIASLESTIAGLREELSKRQDHSEEQRVQGGITTQMLRKTCVVLYTSYVSNQQHEVDWRKVHTALEGKRVRFTAVDGADEANKVLRSALWAL